MTDFLVPGSAGTITLLRGVAYLAVWSRLLQQHRVRILQPDLQDLDQALPRVHRSLRRSQLLTRKVHVQGLIDHPLLQTDRRIDALLGRVGIEGDRLADTWIEQRLAVGELGYQL